MTKLETFLPAPIQRPCPSHWDEAEEPRYRDTSKEIREIVLGRNGETFVAGPLRRAGWSTAWHLGCSAAPNCASCPESGRWCPEQYSGRGLSPVPSGGTSPPLVRSAKVHYRTDSSVADHHLSSATSRPYCPRSVTQHGPNQFTGQKGGSSGERLVPNQPQSSQLKPGTGLIENGFRTKLDGIFNLGKAHQWAGYVDFGYIYLLSSRRGICCSHMGTAFIRRDLVTWKSNEETVTPRHLDSTRAIGLQLFRDSRGAAIAVHARYLPVATSLKSGGRLGDCLLPAA